MQGFSNPFSGATCGRMLAGWLRHNDKRSDMENGRGCVIGALL